MSSTKKKFLFSIFYFLFLFLMANLASYLIMKNILGISIYNLSSYEAKQTRFLKNKNRSSVHPFYGINEEGFSGFESKLSQENNFNSISKKPLKGEIKILVLGGSVASHLSLARSDIKENHLFAKSLNSYFSTDKFVVYNAAVGRGGKQPQQYFKYLYLDLLGFKPDLIINLDGFNEIALPFSENLGRNINAIYPRSFDRAVHSSASNKSCISINNWLLKKNTMIPLLELSKWIYVRHCHNYLTGKGMKWDYTDDALFQIESDNYLSQAINIWKYSSDKIFIHALLDNIPYIHVLQANQYIPSSKKFSNKEKTFFLHNEKLKKPVINYYKLLDLGSLETNLILDQRFIFINEARTAYSDACCHFNKLGMQLIIDNIIENFQLNFIKLLEGKESF